MAAGQDDPEMAEIAEECKQEAYDLFLAAAEQRKRMGGLLVQRWVNDWFEQRHFGAIRGIYHEYPYASGRSSIAIWCAF